MLKATRKKPYVNNSHMTTPKANIILQERKINYNSYTYHRHCHHLLLTFSPHSLTDTHSYSFSFSQSCTLSHSLILNLTNLMCVLAVHQHLWCRPTHRNAACGAVVALLAENPTETKICIGEGKEEERGRLPGQ